MSAKGQGTRCPSWHGAILSGAPCTEAHRCHRPHTCIQYTRVKLGYKFIYLPLSSIHVFEHLVISLNFYGILHFLSLHMQYGIEFQKLSQRKMAPRHGLRAAAIPIALVAAWGAVAQVSPAVAAPNQHRVAHDPREEDLLLLVICQAVLVGGDLWIRVSAAAVMISEGVPETLSVTPSKAERHSHVLADAKDTAVKIQKLRQLCGILATQPIHQMPSIGDIAVKAHMVSAVLGRILAPPLL